MATLPSSLKNKPRKRVLILLAVLIVAVAVVLGLLLKPGGKDKAPLPTAVVTRTTLTKSVAATGKVIPNFEVEIKAKASGKIIQLPYDVSDYVKRGALLVELDPIDEDRAVSQAAASLAGLESKTSQSRVNMAVAERTLETDIAKARSDLSAAKAKYTDAHSKAQRLTSLAQQRFISQEEAETGKTTETQARTDLQDAQTRLRELQTQQLALQAQAEDVRYSEAQARAQRVALATSQQRLSETKIYAPISGVVTTRPAQIGNIVASGVSNVGGGTAIMTMADLSRIFVDASVDESDIGQVREGQMVNITADSFPGQAFQGHVVQIAPEGIVTSNVVTFDVKIEVVGANKHLLKPQMTTNVEVLIDRHANVLAVPAEAVVSRNGRNIVRVVGPTGKPRPRPVEVGLNDGTDVEILSGLQEGESVVSG
jgi:HlyD family secretion protein